jgi:uncharacterized membrane protein (UPF0127 family)
VIAAGRRARLVAGAAAVVAAAVVALVVAAAVGGSDPPAPTGSRRALPGFGEVAFRITQADGQVRDWCALLAATAAARRRGLMGQRDLRGYDAMVFRFPEPTTSAFYMYRTVLPLSIAWFDGRGAYVSSRDMAPCRADDPSACPTYPAAGPYRHALEVEQDDLARLGAGPGATLSFAGEGCA